MEAISVPCCKVQAFQTLSLNRSNDPSLRAHRTRMINKNRQLSRRGLRLSADRGHGVATGCVAPNRGFVLEGLSSKEEQEWKRPEDTCHGEEKGVEELLECLECEAIMGENEGKEPQDYNRRAQIFNRSSQVFQALKKDRENSSKDMDSPRDKN